MVQYGAALQPKPSKLQSPQRRQISNQKNSIRRTPRSPADEQLVRSDDSGGRANHTYWKSIVHQLTGVPHAGQHLPGMTQTVSPLARQEGHFLPGTWSRVRKHGGKRWGIWVVAHGKHDERYFWAVFFGLNVRMLLAGHQGRKLLNAHTLEDLMAADVVELVERHCVIVLSESRGKTK